jgi:hypothetical protein
MVSFVARWMDGAICLLPNFLLFFSFFLVCMISVSASFAMYVDYENNGHKVPLLNILNIF